MATTHAPGAASPADAMPAPHSLGRSPREPLPPGILPHITDTDPPPLHPATVIGDGVVYVDQEKLHAAQAAHATTATPMPGAHAPAGGA